MIEWPTHDRFPASVLKNVEDFRRTSAALELDAEPCTWVFETLPWTESAAAPMRLILRNERMEQVAISLDADGIWRKSPRTPAVRAKPSPAWERAQRGSEPRIAPPRTLHPIALMLLAGGLVTVVFAIAVTMSSGAFLARPI